MIAVFDAPMASDGGSEVGGGQGDLGGVIRDLLGGDPRAQCGVLVPGQPGDADDGGAQVGPVGAKTVAGREDLDTAMLLPAMAVAIDGLDLSDTGLRGATAAGYS